VVEVLVDRLEEGGPLRQHQADARRGEHGEDREGGDRGDPGAQGGRDETAVAGRRHVGRTR
jgi:hypothetical protein